MGAAAVCYKAKPTSISKDDVLRALNDKHLRETITEPDGIRTYKTDEGNHNAGLLTFGNLTQQLQMDTQEIQNTLTNNYQGQGQSRINRMINLNQQNSRPFGQVELNILTYYGYKEDIYDTLTMMSRKSLYFMKKNYKKIEGQINLKHANERIRLIQVKSIEEHSSGVNQLLKTGPRELVTVSDDCYLKFWSSQSLRVDTSIGTETITCIVQTGFKSKDILVAGCHSGNLITISASQRMKKDQISQAHYNLIRVAITLEALKNRYFVTADVCGVVRVWTSQFKPTLALELDLVQAISYNSMIEVQDFLPRRSTYEETALIACALKSQKVNLILLLPSSGTYQVIKSLSTLMKPTCLIQLSTKHLAVAVGSLKENSEIEIHDMNSGVVISRLRHHTDMIDSLLKIQFPNAKSKSKNQYVTWLISASRDRQMVLWKLIDGKIMTRNSENLYLSLKKQSGVPDSRSAQKNKSQSEEQKKSLQSKKSSKDARKNANKKRQSNNPSDGNDDDYEDSKQYDDDYNEEKGLMDDRNEEEKEFENMAQSSRKLDPKRQSQNSTITGMHVQNEKAMLLDYFFALDSGHKDFIRSMVQINDNTVITASEDKTIKVFTITF